MTRRVRLLPRAKEDFRGIASHIERSSIDGAERWRRAILSKADEVANDPKRFAVSAEDPMFTITIRDALFRTPKGLAYRLVFTFDDDSIYVLRIRGPGQPPLTSDEV